MISFFIKISELAIGKKLHCKTDKSQAYDFEGLIHNGKEAAHKLLYDENSTQGQILANWVKNGWIFKSVKLLAFQLAQLNESGKDWFKKV